MNARPGVLLHQAADCHSLTLCIGQIEASTSSPGIPQAFDTFAVPGRREFDYRSLPGGGEFDPHVSGVGNLNCTLDFMWNLWRGELSLDTVLEDFRGQDCAFVANWLRGKGLNKLSAVFEGTFKYRGQLPWPAASQQVGFFFIERFVCCMTHEENLSIQWAGSSDYCRFAREFCS